nr:hypothetical protein GCM10020093_057270 [Planobispora longispora]
MSHMSEPIPNTFDEEQPRDPYWFKRAVFYEVLIRGFADSNGDGTGDIRGLIQKLDYLQWLGVDCLWLLPLYESPLRDGGYDISDFMKILPDFGDLGDFVKLVDEAHKRGMRVIADLVMNHTSDQHPWFQASRHDPEGPFGDFYVWSDTDERYQDARIIFIDTETSNWTYDPVRQQYYWHRFFHHQPDLNYENPDVQNAMLEVLRFWLDLGIDGFRMDAIPYLFETEGTNCENLPRTHEYLKRVRAEVDRIYPDRVLLAEANQWPADVVEYFGDPATGGDECHMAFHFPLMPRIFMAVRRESRYPISEILAQTPKIPENCQWGIFLRNHDELTLEMVTDDERDYMYSEYAKDPGCAPTSASGAAWPRCWRTTATRSSCSPRCCCRCRAPRCSTTATRSAWATTSGSATATASAPRCSGARTATPGSPTATRAGSTSRSSWTRSTATRASTSRPSRRAAARCCTGPGG